MTVPRNKKEDTTRFIPTPDRQLDCLSGYCITGHHDTCYFQFSFGRCGCDCHVDPAKYTITDDNIIDVTNEELIVIEDPRPWIKQ